MKFNYYACYAYVSHSELTAFQKQQNLIEDPENLQDIYDFGNLFDAHTLESNEDTVDPHNFSLTCSTGEVIYYSAESIAKADVMKQAFWNDQEIQKMCIGMKFQKMFFRERFEIIYEGFTFYMKVRCKFDGFSKALALELKGLGCSTFKQFTQAIEFFNYDRAAAWYMDIAKIDRLLIVAVGKNRHRITGQYPVFKFAVTRDDETYKRGKAKYQKLAFDYYFQIYQLFQ